MNILCPPFIQNDNISLSIKKNFISTNMEFCIFHRTPSPCNNDETLEKQILHELNDIKENTRNPDVMVLKMMIHREGVKNIQRGVPRF